MFALHISWTCYGNWLPGDERGYVSSTLRPDGRYAPRENTPRTPYKKDSPATRERAVACQKWPAVRLTAEQAGCVAAALVRAAAARRWRVLRAAVMANHVHVVVADCPDDGPLVRRALKGVTQAALSDHAGGPRRWWTEAGSDRYKHGEDAVRAAVGYVAGQEWMLAGVDDMRAFAVGPAGEQLPLGEGR
jgi:REP element-mobilizing transposase RayT